MISTERKQATSVPNPAPTDNSALVENLRPLSRPAAAERVHGKSPYFRYSNYFISCYFELVPICYLKSHF